MMRSALGIFAGGALLIALGYVAGAYYQGVPDPSDWYTVGAVTVQDARSGEDPQMSVDRIIHANFAGTWSAEVTSDDGKFVCSAKNVAKYTTYDRAPEAFGLFSWWLWDGRTPQQQCIHWPLPEGCYFVDTTWEFQPDGWRKTSVSKRSNTFCITPAG